MVEAPGVPQDAKQLVELPDDAWLVFFIAQLEGVYGGVHGLVVVAFVCECFRFPHAVERLSWGVGCAVGRVVLGGLLGISSDARAGGGPGRVTVIKSMQHIDL